MGSQLDEAMAGVGIRKSNNGRTSAAYLVWCAVCGVWCVVCGVWCGVWSTFCKAPFVN